MPLRRSVTRAGLVAGYAADVVFGDPQRGHPVAFFGRAAGALEQRTWADSRWRGVLYAGLCVGAAAGFGLAVQTATRRHPLGRFAATAVATWVVLGGRGLATEGNTLAELLEDCNLPAARQRLSHLCARDAADLDTAALARAATESIAENTSDAIVAPLLWGGIAGIPGLLAYRALNTLDAMVGYHSPRFEKFGWAAARGDDLANLVPARIGAAVTAACAQVIGGSASRAWRVWRRDGSRHPSPNAGQVEAAFAGALDVRLGGVNSYGGRTEERGALGDGPEPGAADLRRSVALSRTVGLVALGIAVGMAR